MFISRNRATMLIDIHAKISEKLGISIGYIHPNAAFLSDNNEFIIRESPDRDDEEIQLVHISDLKLQRNGNILVHRINDEPQGDEKVQEMLDKINDAVLNGIIAFDPGVTRTIDGIEISITQKELPGGQSVKLYELPMVGPHGHMFSYPAICDLSKVDSSFRAAKKIIDTEWPEEKEYWEQRKLEEQPSKLVNKLKKKFLKWLLGDE